MVDLHCHLLPAVDDGARSFDEAAAMCQAAASDGCRALVATPHQRHPRWWNDDLRALSALRDELQQKVGSTPRIHLGGEVRCDAEVLSAVDRLSTDGGILTLAGSRYILLELNGAGIGPDPREIVHEIGVAGLIPVLAHPECIPWLADDIGLLSSLVEGGALLQITGSSVLGDFGRKPQARVKKMLDLDLVHFVASDCHRLDHRPPQQARARQAIVKGWGANVAWRLFEANPGDVIRNRPLRAVA